MSSTNWPKGLNLAAPGHHGAGWGELPETNKKKKKAKREKQ